MRIAKRISRVTLAVEIQVRRSPRPAGRRLGKYPNPFYTWNTTELTEAPRSGLKHSHRQSLYTCIKHEQSEYNIYALVKAATSSLLFCTWYTRPPTRSRMRTILAQVVAIYFIMLHIYDYRLQCCRCVRTLK